MPADLENDMKQIGARLLAEAPPVTTAEVLRHTAERSTSPAAIDPLIADVPVVSEPRSGNGRRVRWPFVASVAAASMLVVGLGLADRAGDDEPAAVGTASTVDSGTAAPATSPSSSDVAVSPTSAATSPIVSGDSLAWPPRVLLDESWTIADASERSANEGYMRFERDGVSVFVGWYRGQTNGPDWYKDHGYTEAGTGTLLGESVTIYEGQLGYRVGDLRDLIESGQLESELVPTEVDSPELTDSDIIGGEFLEAELTDAIAAGLIEGVATQGPEASLLQNGSSLSVQVMQGDSGFTPEDFGALLGTLHQVEPAAWEALLPDGVVTPSERPAVVEEMLTGVALTGDIDVTSVGDPTLVQNRDELANTVLRLAACASLNRYFGAPDPNSPEAVAALEAIATIPDWPIAQQLSQLFADAQANPEVGPIGVSNNGLQSLAVDEDGAIIRSETGEVLDGYAAAQMCDPNTVG